MLKKIKNFIKNFFSFPILVLGFLYFIIKSKTPAFIYQSYVRSYCVSNGRIRGFLSFFLKKKIIKKFSINSSKIFNNNVNFSKIDYELKNKGYYIFEEKLNEEIVNNFYNFSLNTKCFGYDDKKIYFNEYYKVNKSKRSSKYALPENEVLNFKETQELILDPVFINIAQNYFNNQPCLSAADMWWSPARNVKINEEIEKNNSSAQLYHFDLDRIMWLKLFIYLTDTNDENDGPHEYVEATNKVGSKSKELLNLGYNRIPEDLIGKFYSDSLIKRIFGKKGTMFIADTSCYHRGLPPVQNDRLMLVIEYSNSLFGSSYDKIKVKNNILLNSPLLNTNNKIYLDL